MADDLDTLFRIQLESPRNRGESGVRATPLFRHQISIAMRQAGGSAGRAGRQNGTVTGRFNARGRGAKVMASLATRNDAWETLEGGLRYRSRRVVVKARIVKLAQGHCTARTNRTFVVGPQAVDVHLRYLQRDGVDKEGQSGRLYSAYDDEVDGKAFLKRARQDRHQFRFIIAPEEAADLDDLRGFTRDLMRQMESDLASHLDWVAVDHHNTGHPHSHILLRGITDEGKTLNIAGDYIAYGIRHRASERLTLELGPQSELDAAEKLAWEVGADRLTRLDRVLIAQQRQQGLVDLSPSAGNGERIFSQIERSLLIDRMHKLEGMGLAQKTRPGRWLLATAAEKTLKDLGTRRDIIKTMHRALEAHGLSKDRRPSHYALHDHNLEKRVVGQVLATGLAGDELSERLHVIIDGDDGRVHYIETATDTSVEQGQIIALEPEHYKTERRAGDSEVGQQKGKLNRPVRNDGSNRATNGRNLTRCTIHRLSSFNLEEQIVSTGATWLDRQLLSQDGYRPASSGFGKQVTQALNKRAGKLVEMGIAQRNTTNNIITFPPDMLHRLEVAEVARAGHEIASARGRAFVALHPGQEVRGKLAGATDLAGGRYAILDDGHRLHLVPWEPTLENAIGHTVGVRVHTTGVKWTISHQRGIGIGDC